VEVVPGHVSRLRDHGLSILGAEGDEITAMAEKRGNHRPRREDERLRELVASVGEGEMRMAAFLSGPI
jgi:hypothetical protein